eukprot:XP_001699578.1 predicted protein [Chlamydomonas reinhardtii]
MQAELQVLPGPLTPLLTRACTLQDLGPEDKQKVTKLLKQVVELGQEVQTLRQQRDETAKQYSQREEELKETHRQLHKEHLLLKKKLGQVLLVLRASQAKVHALEAAQQAAELPQKTQPSNDRSGESDAAALPRDQEAEPQAQAGLGRAVGSTATGCPSSPAPKAASAPSLLHVAPGTHAPGPNPVIAIPTTTAAMPAATVEDHAVGAGPAGAGAGGSRARAGPRSIQVNSSMQHFEAVPVDEVLLESPTGQVGSPMIVPPSEDVVAAASSLLGWQAQQGFMSADEATSTLRPVPGPGDDAPVCSAGSGAAAARGRAVSSHANVGSGSGAMARKVLSYDPAIGKNGAFYFVDVDSPPASDVLPAGRPPIHNKAGAGRVIEHAQLQGALCTPSSATSSMTLGAGGTTRDPATSGGAGMHAGHASTLHMVALGRAMGQGHGQELQQPLPTVLQPPQSVAPFSPYSYAASDSTAAVTPLAPLHAAALALARAGAGNGRLAAGSCNSITGVKHAPHAGAGSRRAGVGFAETPGSATGSLYRMAGMLEDLARQQHWDMQPPPGVAPAQPLMPAASPKPGAAQEQQQQQAVGMAGGPQAVAAWLEENAGSASSVGGSCITDRYDESLVDILSQKVSIDALLAANIFEENDVLSAILEQER